MDFLLIILLVLVAYFVYDFLYGGVNFERIDVDSKALTSSTNDVIGYNGEIIAPNSVDPDSPTVREVVYTQEYYPWWRSNRDFAVDGWLYQKPYYNYWRRPYYYNYYMSGRPVISGGKLNYNRDLQRE